MADSSRTKSFGGALFFAPDVDDGSAPSHNAGLRRARSHAVPSRLLDQQGMSKVASASGLDGEKRGSLTGLNAVAVEGDSSSDSDDETHQSNNKMKQIKKFQSLKVDKGTLQEEFDHELAQAASTGDCNLSKLELTVFPAQIVSLTNLHTLSLSENQIEVIDESLGSLTFLSKLDLTGNRLKTLPVSIFQLPNLACLLADHNDLQFLPLAQVRPGQLLPSLVVFGVEWNDIDEFPNLLVQCCPKLEKIFIAENERVNLPCGAFFEQLSRSQPLFIKIDNKPVSMEHVRTEGFDRFPWITVEWNKIYPDKVLDFLFLGSLRTAQRTDVYRELNIGYILTTGRSLDVKVCPGMKHLVLPVDDLPGEDMTPLYDEAFQFIDQAKADQKGILIHCFAGLSRSVTVTVAYLMHKMFPMTRDEALELVRKSRPAAQPNQGFMDGLLRYENYLRETMGMCQ